MDGHGGPAWQTSQTRNYSTFSAAGQGNACRPAGAGGIFLGKKSAGVNPAARPEDRNSFMRSAASLLLIALAPTLPAAQPKPLEFRVTFAPVVSDKPFTGRV